MEKQEFGRCIFVIEGGFVMTAARATREGSLWSLENTRTIRVWGTEGVGLAQLTHGPTKDTVLDVPSKATFVNADHVLFIMPATGSWE